MRLSRGISYVDKISSGVSNSKFVSAKEISLARILDALIILVITEDPVYLQDIENGPQEALLPKGFAFHDETLLRESPLIQLILDLILDS